MKKEVEQKLNRYSSLDQREGYEVITEENLPIEKSTRKPVEGEVHLKLKDGDSGFRVTWNNGNYGAIIEEKIGDEWVAIGGIQKLTIEFDVNAALPIVKMERYIL